MSTKSLKVVITKKHTLIKINSIIDSKHPGILILESSSPDNNLKTQFIAQNLMKNGFKSDKMKHYKGELFKVILSQK
ncbi:MAG: hypothetical protein CVT90_00740 [Candidatus Altiarchaeales archaeon HGW-Altiarchaeales-3]|nr:MAG: hypothetical protein CVT90_00740 [Candidatus Altiarchaeales archaeon HGW-Altiarchaeales-3]